MTEKVFSVVGMHCSSCVELIRDEVGDLEGVDSVSVDLAGGAATVTYDPDQTDDAAIVAAIKAAGYETAPAATD